MAQYAVRDYSQRDWTGILSAFPSPNLIQSWEFGEARAAAGGWRVERGVVTGEASVKKPVLAAAQVMIRPLPGVGGGLAWISRGPLWRGSGNDGPAEFSRVLAALRRHYVDDLGLYLRIAPPLADKDGAVTASAAAEFETTATRGWASASVDLSQSTEQLRRGLKQKWRNGLNKAERSGIAVEDGFDDALFDGFLREYRTFIDARGFDTSVTPPFLAALQGMLPGDRKMICYRGSHDGEALGSALIARSGDRAEYLAGTLLDAGRKLSVGQLLLWRAICDAKEAGLRWFDVGGMDPELTPKGIYDFKSGIGGEPYRLAPEIEAQNGSLRARLVRWRVNRARDSGAAGG
jgi:hypothetical protein